MMKSVNGSSAGLRRPGIFAEEIFHACIIAPRQRVRILSCLIGHRLAEPVPAGNPRGPRRQHEHFGCAQFLRARQRPPLLKQSGTVPAGPLDDAGVHRPQIRGYQQAATEHHQTEEGAN